MAFSFSRDEGFLHAGIKTPGFSRRHVIVHRKKQRFPVRWQCHQPLSPGKWVICKLGGENHTGRKVTLNTGLKNSSTQHSR